MPNNNNSGSLPEDFKSIKTKILKMLQELLIKSEESERMKKENEKKEETGYFQQIIRFINPIFVYYFQLNPFALIGENNPSFKELVEMQLFERVRLIFLLTIFAYSCYYIFGQLCNNLIGKLKNDKTDINNKTKTDINNKTKKTNYIKTSIWYWIMLFATLMMFIRIKPSISSPIPTPLQNIDNPLLNSI